MSVLDNIMLGRHVHMRPSALASLFYWVWALREELANRRSWKKSSNSCNSRTFVTSRSR
jgi:hypothetical protein